MRILLVSSAFSGLTQRYLVLGCIKLSIKVAANKSGFDTPKPMHKSFISQLGINSQRFDDRFSSPDTRLNQYGSSFTPSLGRVPLLPKQ